MSMSNHDIESIKNMLNTFLHKFANADEPSYWESQYNEIQVTFKQLLKYHLPIINPTNFQCIYWFVKHDIYEFKRNTKTISVDSHNIIERDKFGLNAQAKSNDKQIYRKACDAKRMHMCMTEIDLFFKTIELEPVIPRPITGNPIIDNAPVKIELGSRVTTLTRDDVETLLKYYNRVNRTINNSNVKTLVDEFTENRFSAHVQNMKIIADGLFKGDLADSQHRLKAFLESGRETIDVIISLIPESDLHKVDSGKPRNEADKVMISAKLNQKTAMIKSTIPVSVVLKYKQQLVYTLFSLSNANASTSTIYNAGKSNECRSEFIDSFWIDIQKNMESRCQQLPLSIFNKHITYAFIALLEYSVGLDKSYLIDTFHNFLSIKKFNQLPSNISDLFTNVENSPKLKEHLELFTELWNYVCNSEPKIKKYAGSNLSFVDVKLICAILKLDKVIEKTISNEKAGKYKKRS